jgi:hypothetical protein
VSKYVQCDQAGCLTPLYLQPLHFLSLPTFHHHRSHSNSPGHLHRLISFRDLPGSNRIPWSHETINNVSNHPPSHLKRLSSASSPPSHSNIHAQKSILLTGQSYTPSSPRPATPSPAPYPHSTAVPGPCLPRPAALVSGRSETTFSRGKARCEGMN